MITQNIHVRMDAYGIPPVIHAVEGDTWRYLDIYTDDAAINTSNTAVVAIHRPDDSYYTIEAMPEPLFYHLEMDQALTRPGKVECQLKVSSGDLVVSTYTFYVIVEPSTTGLPIEQLGYDIYDLIDAAQQIQNVGLTEEIKQALLDCFEHVAWTDEHGQDYVDALEAALYPPAELASISAVYTQSGTVYATDTLDSLKTNLVVTAHYTDSTTETVTTYTLSGTLTEGTSVITVTYEGKTTTFNVTVTAPATLSSITAVYTQSGTVYDTDTLDSLKSDLVVTAVYSDSTTQTVASTDYTLSGTLTEGTSTITVAYGGKTTTFTVTVTHQRVPSGYTEYDYIKLTIAEGTNYRYGIIAPVSMSSDYSYEFSFLYTSTSLSNAANIIGTRNRTGGTKEFGFFVTPSTGKLGYWLGGTDTTTQITNLVANQLNTIKVLPVGKSSQYPTYITINSNGTEFSSSSTKTGETWDEWFGMFIYASSASSFGPQQAYNGCQIGEIIVKDVSDNLVYDFIPVYNGTVYGMYEAVNNVFYNDSSNADKYVCGNWE